MAEVFKAKSYGVEGFEKIIAIKRILPTMGEDRDFIKMFIDEAKIAGQLAHSNICQIFELGRIDGSHFIAMEFIWGKDLLQIQNRLRKVKSPMQIAMACYVIAKTCEGLDYAHRKRDQVGRPMEIVHRDCSPQNVLVSYEGEVKVIDFGIAKASSRTARTQAGVLKGKFGYMSPEQVRGLPLDRRSDIFALGTMLYECLTGTRLFQGETDFATLEKVRNVAMPSPRSVNPNIPEVVEKIILKSLTKDVDERYAWCSEMLADLQAYLMSQSAVFTAKTMAAAIKELFAAEVDREKEQLEQYKKMGRDGLIAGVPSAAAKVNVIEELGEAGEAADPTMLGGPTFDELEAATLATPPTAAAPALASQQMAKGAAGAIEGAGRSPGFAEPRRALVPAPATKKSAEEDFVEEVPTEIFGDDPATLDVLASVPTSPKAIESVRRATSAGMPNSPRQPSHDIAPPLAPPPMMSPLAPANPSNYPQYAAPPSAAASPNYAPGNYSSGQGYGGPPQNYGAPPQQYGAPPAIAPAMNYGAQAPVPSAQFPVQHWQGGNDRPMSQPGHGNASAPTQMAMNPPSQPYQYAQPQASNMNAQGKTLMGMSAPPMTGSSIVPQLSPYPSHDPNAGHYYGQQSNGGFAQGSFGGVAPNYQNSGGYPVGYPVGAGQDMHGLMPASDQHLPPAVMGTSKPSTKRRDILIVLGIALLAATTFLVVKFVFLAKSSESPSSSGSGSGIATLRVSVAACNAAAKCNVLVDGKKIGGIVTSSDFPVTSGQRTIKVVDDKGATLCDKKLTLDPGKTGQVECAAAGSSVGSGSAALPADTTTSPRVADAKAPATDTKIPATDTQIPATDTKTPASDTKIPATDTKTPATDTKIPATDTKTPASDTKIPATDTKTPAPTDTKTAPVALDPKKPLPPGNPIKHTTDPKTPDKTVPVAADAMGYLVVYSTPAGAHVTVDGADTGKVTPVAGRNRIELTPGKHKVLLSAGDIRTTYPVIIKAGVTETLSRELK
jgi:hypothetical protein